MCLYLYLSMCLYRLKTNEQRKEEILFRLQVELTKPSQPKLRQKSFSSSRRRGQRGFFNCCVPRAFHAGPSKDAV